MNGLLPSDLGKVHDCPSCRCGWPRCSECGCVLPDHYDSPFGLSDFCSRHPIVRAVKADERKRGVYDPESWK